MTIAIGIVARDGIVVAADTETTAGDFKSHQGKIRWQSKDFSVGHPLGACVVSGAGRLGYLNCLSQKILVEFNATPDVTAHDAMQEVFANVVQTFHADHVMPYHDAPIVEMIIAYQRDHQFGLWSSDRGTLTMEKLAAVGIGASAARLTLNRLWDARCDFRSAVALAIHVVAKVKERVVGCGQFTDVAYITDNFAGLVPRHTIDDVEAALRFYDLATDAQSMQHVLGVDVGIPIKTIAKTRTEIMRLLTSIPRQPIRSRPTRGRKGRPPSPE